MMKKKFSIGVILLLTFVLASCHKDDDGHENQNTNTDSVINRTDDNWVDLGLPSGLLWAKCNLGATTPESNGNHYAWGEIQPKSTYSWDSYTYCDNENNILKYNTNDSLTVLQPGDDAATVTFGTGVRTPTKEDWQELIDNTIGEWTTINEVPGRLLTATNGKTLFLPAAGACIDDGFDRVGYCGWYWSSSLSLVSPRCAALFSFGFTGDANIYATNFLINDRYRGYSVRPVRSEH